MDQDAGAVDDRLNPGPAQNFERAAQALDQRLEVRNRLSSPQRRHLPADESNHSRARQTGVAERLQDFFHGGNGA